jgi:MlaC protein
MPESQHGRVSGVTLTDRGGLLGRARLIVEHRRVDDARDRLAASAPGGDMAGRAGGVQSRIVSIRREATELDYVMSQTPAGCKVVDVLAAGSIRVAVQRSDFRHILANGGCDALLVSLERKTADLSGRALV